jgi:hypothetical protein
VRCCVREKDRILALWEGRQGREGKTERGYSGEREGEKFIAGRGSEETRRKGRERNLKKQGRQGRKGIKSLFKSRVEQRGAHAVQRAEQRGMEHRERGKMFMKMNDCDHKDHPIA